MSKVSQHFRTYGLSYVFCAVLAVLSLVIGITTAPSFQGWCQTDETAVVCLRNWANAGGNIFAVIIASVAAIFAFVSMNAAVQQTRLNTMPLLTSRYDVADELLSIANAMFSDVFSVMSYCDALRLSLKEPQLSVNPRVFPFHENLKSISKSDESWLSISEISYNQCFLADLTAQYSGTLGCGVQYRMTQETLQPHLNNIRSVLDDNRGKQIGRIYPLFKKEDIQALEKGCAELRETMQKLYSIRGELLEVIEHVREQRKLTSLAK